MVAARLGVNFVPDETEERFPMGVGSHFISKQHTLNSRQAPEILNEFLELAANAYMVEAAWLR